MKKKTNSSFMLPLGAVLHYLLIASLLFTGVTFAKFTSVSTGSDTAKVASFDVRTEYTDKDINITFADSENTASDSFPLTVISNSEVAVEYDIQLSWSSTLSSQIEINVGIDGGASQQISTSPIVFSNIGEFAPTDTELRNEHNFNITVTKADGSSEEITVPDITIEVIARQID